MNHKRTSLYVICFAGIMMLSAASFVNAARPEYYGFSPAFPKSSELPPFDSTFPYMENEQSILLLLEIDQTGSFKKTVPNTTADSVISKYVVSSLKNLTFEPALKNGRPASSTLPVLATVNPRFRRVTIEFPVNADFQITNRSLYFRALEQLGVELSEIKKFPPYFCDLRVSDSLKFLPITLVKVNLNEVGQVDSSEIVKTNLPAFARQVQSAALWAEISPLKLEGNVTRGATFLLVSFFPQLQYPTKQIEFKGDSVYQWHEHWRVRLLSDTVGLMLPALPKNREIGELTVRREDRYLFGEVMARLMVDTLGNVRVISIDTKNPPLHKAVALALKDVKFFPATAYNGEIVDYYGAAHFSFRNRSSVQVEYLWLND